MRMVSWSFQQIQITVSLLLRERQEQPIFSISEEKIIEMERWEHSLQLASKVLKVIKNILEQYWSRMQKRLSPRLKPIIQSLKTLLWRSMSSEIWLSSTELNMLDQLKDLDQQINNINLNRGKPLLLRNTWIMVWWLRLDLLKQGKPESNSDSMILKKIMELLKSKMKINCWKNLGILILH